MTIFITHPVPLDVSSVRDPGMQSVIILAASLGWNVHQKQNQPVVITARDGTQRRLATNTSIRMGVFQSALSSVMAHTEDDLVATTELIDAIIAITKPSQDHKRRLRLAIGESPTQHRERVVAHEAEIKGSREPEPLTTRIDEVLDAHFREVLEEVAAPEWNQGPADGGDHGKLISRKPLMAVRGDRSRVTRQVYESDTSYERVWADDYVDYECMVCGRAFTTSRGVGAHIQRHPERKVVAVQPAWARARVTETIRRSEPIAAPAAVIAADPPAAEPTEPVENRYAALVTQIMDLVLPEHQARVDEEIKALQEENQQLRARLDEVEGEFDAFIELASSRRKRDD